MAIEIRELWPADHDEVLALWPPEESVTPSLPSPRQLLERRNVLSVIARDEGEVVGAMVCGLTPQGYQHRVAVAESYRDGPLLRQLVDKALGKLMSCGVTRCHIHIGADPANAQMWEAARWRPAATDQ